MLLAEPTSFEGEESEPESTPNLPCPHPFVACVTSDRSRKSLFAMLASERERTRRDREHHARRSHRRGGRLVRPVRGQRRDGRFGHPGRAAATHETSRWVA